MTNIDSIIEQTVARARRAMQPESRLGGLPERPLFITISGAHLYGFPSADSDIDLRGSHLLPLEEVIGLKPVNETHELHGAYIEGIEVDCVSHEIGKFLRLLTKKNGYVLEQILSPLVVHDSGCLEELRALARGAITRHIIHHYKGFFATQEKLVLKAPEPTAKAVLYLFRVAMTGLHLLRTGEVEANIVRLNDAVFRLSFIPDLVARKVNGTEKGILPAPEFRAVFAEAKALEAQFDAAFEKSPLPDTVQNYDAIHDFLVRERLKLRAG